MYRMSEFQHPRGTRSGESVAAVWGALREGWGVYKRAALEDDMEGMRDAASRIMRMQDDLGIKQAEFPELDGIEIWP